MTARNHGLVARGGLVARSAGMEARNSDRFRLRGTDRSSAPVDVLPGFDGTSTLYDPTLPTHFRAMGLQVPAYMHLYGSGGPTFNDEAYDLGEIASGAGHSYIQGGAESALYTSRGVALVDGTVGMGQTLPANTSSPNTGGADATYQPRVECVIWELLSMPAALRALHTLSGNNAYIGILNSGGAKLRPIMSSAGLGTYSYLDSKRHMLWVEVDPGAEVLAHAGAGVFHVSTEKETTITSAPWAIVGEGVKGIGAGGSGQTSPAAIYYKKYVWLGNAATALMTLGPHECIVRFGMPGLLW